LTIIKKHTYCYYTYTLKGNIQFVYSSVLCWFVVSLNADICVYDAFFNIKRLHQKPCLSSGHLWNTFVNEGAVSKGWLKLLITFLSKLKDSWSL